MWKEISIIAVGLNHQTTPVEIREQFTLAHCALRMALEDFRNHLMLDRNGESEGPSKGKLSAADGIILSTCHRFEIYASVGDVELGLKQLRDFLVELNGDSHAKLESILYTYQGREAIEHLMRVAAGLDSMILGEPQILGQVTRSFLEAQRTYKLGPIISQAFTRAIKSGKRARSETDIGHHALSLGYAGARIIQEKIGDLSKAHVLLVGAGEIGELAAGALKKYHPKEIRVVNRTYSRAIRLAREIRGRAVNWHSLVESLSWADVVLTATDAPHLIIHATDVMQILSKRSNRSILFVDIAFPRNVDPAIKELNGVELLDIDDLQLVVDENTEHRRAAIPQVEAIIDQEIESFNDWLSSRQLVPVIKELRQKVSSLVDEELCDALRRLRSIDPKNKEIIERMAHRITNRILHDPTTRLKAEASNGNGLEYADSVRELFNLDKQGP